LGIDYELGAYKAANATKRKEMEREDNIGLGKVATASRKDKKEDSLPFLRKPSSKFGSGIAIQPTRKRPTPSGGSIDKIFQQEKRRLILPLGNFSISTSFQLMLHGLLF